MSKLYLVNGEKHQLHEKRNLHKENGECTMEMEMTM